LFAVVHCGDISLRWIYFTDKDHVYNKGVLVTREWIKPGLSMLWLWAHPVLFLPEYEYMKLKLPQI
jgi:hypothetical protein